MSHALLRWTALATLAIAPVIAPFATARDIYVNNESGDDKSTAAATQDKPLRTIHAAVKLTQPGDTIHLAPTPTPYHEVAEFHNKAGEPGKPITLDGHGATLYGCDPLKPEDWKEVSPGLWRSDNLYTSHKMDDAVIVRYFFLFDGHMQRMGRTSKGTKAPWKKPEDLQPNEWTFIESDKTFFVKLQPGVTIADSKVEFPARSNGVAVSGTGCEHLVFRNLTATHVYNDGYNIHGKCRDVHFENIRAIECGDDGVSAHDDCWITVSGLISVGNSTGITHAGDCHSDTDHAIVVRCHAFGYFMFNTGVHTLRDSFIDGDIPHPIALSGNDGRSQTKPLGVCHMKLDNVLVVGTGKTKLNGVNVGVNGDLDAHRLTTLNLAWVVQGNAALHDSAILGDRTAAIDLRTGSKWIADHNAYALHHIRLDKTFWQTDAQFTDYNAATGQDAASRWLGVPSERPTLKMLPSLPSGVGADPLLAPNPSLIPPHRNSQLSAKIKLKRIHREKPDNR